MVKMGDKTDKNDEIPSNPVEEKEDAKSESEDTKNNEKLDNENDKGGKNGPDHNRGLEPSRGDRSEHSSESDEVGTPDRPTTIPVTDPNKSVRDTPKKRGFRFSPSRRRKAEI
jgi:hypothetical protein